MIFNRPSQTRMVFEKIKKVKPAKLFIAADGPRPGYIDDEKKCLEARKIIQSIDWDCDLKTKFSDNNLGCKIAISSSISWFFLQEEEGIILEDDCLPALSFFQFADEMLSFYRFNNNITHICGCNFQDKIIRGTSSYYFSNLTHVWGWAAWRRSWKNYDVEMKLLPAALKDNSFPHISYSRFNHIYLRTMYDNIKRCKIDTWDYQYSFLNLYNRKLSVIPNCNLISNIGFDNQATHTKIKNKQSNIPVQEMKFPLNHPSVIVANKEADNYTLKKEAPATLIVLLIYFKNLIKKVMKY